MNHIINDPSPPRRVNNTKALFLALGLLAIMIGLVSQSVTLYRLFCQATGAGGNTQRVSSDDGAILDREMTIRFNTDVNGALPWHFKPVKRSVKVKIGEEKLVYFEAINNSNETITGTATFNVTPFKAAGYFNKIQCFCFTEQTLAPGEKVKMPVTFFIDPDLVKDKRLDEIKEITLSYTFFRKKVDK